MKLRSIQCLRGIAVLLVSYSHAINLQSEFSISKQQNFFYLAKFGAIGADIFFVISGFIISYVTSRLFGLKHGIHFLHKRILRIYPIYYLITFFQIGLIYLFVPNFHIKYIIKSLRDSLILIPIINNQSVIPIIKTAWTLEFEWYFYIILFFLIIIKIPNKTTWALVIIVIIIIASKIFEINDFRLKMVSNPIMLEFLFGVIIYNLYLKVKGNTVLCYSTMILAVLAVCYNIFLGYPRNIPALSAIFLDNSGLKRALLWGIPSALFTGSCIFFEKIKLNNFNYQPLLLIGNASYSIYLLNLPLEFLLRSIYRKIGFFMLGDIAVFFHLFVYIGIGIIFYRLIEEKLLKMTIQ